MAAAELRMPADIFEEMAGVREIVPAQSDIAADNVNLPEEKTPVDEARLSQAGIVIVKSIPKFVEHIKKLAKKLKDMQAPPEPPSPKKFLNPIVVTIHLFESLAEAGARVLTQIWDYLKNEIWDVFKSILGKIWDFLKSLVKWAFKMLWNLGKMIIRLFWSLFKLALKIIWKLMKAIAKVLWKVMQWIWKMITKLAKAFWNLIMKLLHRIQKKKKLNPKKPDFFRNVGPKTLSPEAPPMPAPKVPNQFAEPTATMDGMQVILKMKKPKPFNTKKLTSKKSFNIRRRGKRESIIWRLVKGVFNMFLRMLSKLVEKIFGKIIDKLVDTVVRIIVRFVMMQIIGSCVPGLGNAFALAMTAITAIIMIADAVDFIQGLQKMINGNGTEEDDEPDDEPDDEDNDGAKVPEKLTTGGLYEKLKDMESKGLQNTAAYNQYKKDYMVQLLKQAEATGNISEVKALKEAMGLSVDSDINSSSVNPAVLNKLNLADFQLNLERKARDIHFKRLEENKTKLITNDEIEEVLISAEGETDWLQFWRRVMEFILNKLPDRYSKATIFKAYDEAMVKTFGLNGTITKDIDHEPYKAKYAERKIAKKKYIRTKNWKKAKHIILTEAAKYKAQQDNILEILRKETTVWGWVKALVMGDYPEIDKTRELVDHYKVNLQEGTEQLRKRTDESNKQQKIKYNNWVDVLIELIKQSQADWENNHKNK
jgi:hypothetical protein